MLRGLWVGFVGIVATVVCGLSVLIALLLGAPSDVSMRAARLWSLTILAALGSPVSYRDRERANPATPCVFISNHQSNADIWVLAAVLSPASRFVAKSELLRVPIVGQVLRRADFVTIDRRNRALAIESLRLAGRRIRDGRSVVLFAEGTRSRDGRLQEFKKGPFHLALAARVPVVPVAIRGSWHALPPHGLRARPAPIEVSFLEPVDPRRFADDDHAGLRDEVRARIADALGEEPSDACAAAEAG